ncbi:hypothetical protein PSQ89_06020 [Pediococcus pentosaceus]|uniref:hypothetical protein n=1 Tax=Pediococcus pentosaceus TaxID=1255 RepID=UPI00235DFF56|nr:hypothetical protein [Pediococcus pentosaceus]MDD1389770.1 hypothetical protein [Pediococcus pentosaceus]
MKLVNLNNQTYINIERIDEIVPWGEDTTRIFIGGNEGHHDIDLPIKKVLDAICGSEEHSFIGYKKLKNKDLSQKAYVDVNNFN